MKSIRIIPALAILALAVADSAAAQQPKRFEITAFGGGVLFPTELPSSFVIGSADGAGVRLDGAEFDAAPAFGLAVGIRPSSRFALELNGTFAPTQVTATHAGQPLVADVKLFLVSAGARLYAPRFTEWLEGYVAAGAGAKIYDYDLQSADVETDFAASFGGGFDIRVAPPVRLRLDVRDHVSWLDPAVSGLDTDVQHDVLLTAGLSFQVPLSRRGR
ncbi:MAG: outer membrane beta-barrel protein [Longimicrobiales bacterium]